MNQIQTQQPKQLSPIEALKQNIMSMTTQFQAALPQHVSVDKFVRVILTAANSNPKLVSADRNSFFSACMKAASDGLLPDGKEAALVPFFMKGGAVAINYIPMLSGILKKVRNSGQLASIDARLVHTNDKFSYYIDETGVHFQHEPADPFGDAGEVRGVYAIAVLKDGSSYFEPLSAKDIQAIKNASKSKDAGPWSGEFEYEMWKKSAIRRLAKRLPMSTDVEQVLENDNDNYELKTEQIQIAAPQIAPEIKSLPESKPQDKTKPSKLSKMIEVQHEESELATEQPDDII
jgi:recombination protein RecT